MALHAKACPADDIARRCGCSRSLVYKVVAEHRRRGRQEREAAAEAEALAAAIASPGFPSAVRCKLLDAVREGLTAMFDGYEQAGITAELMAVEPMVVEYGDDGGVTGIASARLCVEPDGSWQWVDLLPDDEPPRPAPKRARAKKAAPKRPAKRKARS